MTDQLAWMRNQLSRYSYRPGWIMSVEVDRLFDDVAILVVDYPAPDSRNPQRESRFTCRRALIGVWPADPDRLTPARVACLARDRGCWRTQARRSSLRGSAVENPSPANT